MKAGFLAVISGIILFLIVLVWRLSIDEKQVEIRPILLEQQQPKDTNNKVVVTKKTSINTQSNVSHYNTALKDVPKAKLKQRLDTFWQHCRLLQQCDVWLQQLQADVPTSRYQLFASYPEKQLQLIAFMGHDFISNNAKLSDNIERIKQKQRDVFGELSEQLFAQDYALYDYKEKVAQIQIDNIGVDLEYKVEALDQLHRDIASGQTSAVQSPDFLSAQARYQQALSFIDQEQPVQDIEQQKIFLAQHYLPEEEAVAVKQRQLQISLQLQQRQNYQQDFFDFHQQLNNQKKINAAGLSESQWLQYQEQKIFEFRRDYFK